MDTSVEKFVISNNNNDSASEEAGFKSNFNKKRKDLESEKSNDRQDKSSSEVEKRQKIGSTFKISSGMLKYVSTISVASMTNDLLSTVFTSHELGTCSKTGKQANANKGYRTKPPLDKNRLEAVKECVFNKFPATQQNKSLFNSSVRYKLSDAAKRYQETFKFKNEKLN